MRDSSKTFLSVTFPQQFCVNCTQYVVTVMLNQTRSVCYDCNVVLNSFEICILNTRICVASKIACWSEWVSQFSLRLTNNIAILLALKKLFFFHLQYLIFFVSQLIWLLFCLFYLFLLLLFSLMMFHSSSLHNAFVDRSDLADMLSFRTFSCSIPDSLEEARKRQ